MSDKCPYKNIYSSCSWMAAKYVDAFCTNCWTHERFFTGGQSWSPDLCPCGCEDTTAWYKMSPLQRMKAQRKYKKDLEEWRRKNR